MNGPTHYEAAETCLATAHDLMAQGSFDAVADAVLTTAVLALAHAALADVAVTAFGITAGPNAPETKTAEAWRTAIA